MPSLTHNRELALRISVPLCAVFLLLVSVVGRARIVNGDSELKTFPVGVSVRFFCHWWSEATQEGMDPNHPPPYDEYIEIQELSLTDPIATPNPNAIDIVVDIKSYADKDIEGLYVDLLYQWKVGPISDPTESRWDQPESLDDEIIHYLPAGVSRQIKVSPFLMGDKQESLPERSWTWALKIICKVKRIERVKKVAADEKLELTVERVLPMIPGD